MGYGLLAAGLALALAGAGAQHKGAKAKKKEAKKITEQSQGERNALSAKRMDEIIQSLNDSISVEKYGESVDANQAARRQAIEDQLVNDPVSLDYAGDRSDAALAEEARGEIYQANNARKIAKLFGNMQGYSGAMGQIGRDQQRDSARLTRYAPMARSIDINEQKRHADNTKGDSTMAAGEALSTLGQALMAVSGVSGAGAGAGAGAGEIAGATASQTLAPAATNWAAGAGTLGAMSQTVDPRLLAMFSKAS